MSEPRPATIGGVPCEATCTVREARRLKGYAVVATFRDAPPPGLWVHFQGVLDGLPVEGWLIETARAFSPSDGVSRRTYEGTGPLVPSTADA